ITKVARNEFLTDVVEAIQSNTSETSVNVDNITSCLIVKADEETCTKWEGWLELTSEPNWTLQDRIDRIIYTINSKGFFTKKWLKEQANIFTNGIIEVVESFENWHFVVKFMSVIGLPPNLDNFGKMVDLNKPSHLTWEYEFRYRTWGELEPRTWGELEPFTWEQIYSDNSILQRRK
ncbi:MAG: putative phage tail protein, partial [Fusobacteriaceae bacterium]